MPVMVARRIAILILASTGSALAAPQERADADLLATLRTPHPRLILSSDGLQELQAAAERDALAKAGVGQVVLKAERLCTLPTPVYRKVGPRLLHVSRDVVDRMYTLGLAWRLTGRPEFARKAQEDLTAVCRFPDWNPSHFLDTAEMVHGVAIGYDWFHVDLPEASRMIIREGLLRLGLEPGLQSYGGPRPAWWVNSEYNWNLVCNAGLLIGALAVAETDPRYARVLVPAAVASMPRAFKLYEPDGAYPEGLGYWSYATSYAVFGLSALRTALGTDFGLSETSGFSRAGLFPIYTCGPTGLYFNYADNGERSTRRNLPCLFWLSRRYGDGRLADVERAMMERQGATALDLIWYVPPDGGSRAPLDLDRRFGGPVEVAVFRSAWNDPEALFVAAKAGFNQVNHGNLDLGTFELDALGQRWVRDLGRDDYNLPGYWEKGARGRRWTYYRMGSASHSVPLIDGKNQEVDAKARLLDFGEGRVVIDLTEAYRPYSTRTLRTFRLVEGRRGLLVEDEFSLPEARSVTWGLTTDARIETDGAVARLELGGKRLTARIVSPEGATFETSSAEQAAPQARNENVRRLEVRLAPRAGEVRIHVSLLPDEPR